MRIIAVFLLITLSSCGSLIVPERVFVPPDLPAIWPDSLQINALAMDSMKGSNLLLDTLPSYRRFFKDSCLQKLLNIALEQNFDIKTAMAQLSAAQANFVASKSLGLPFVNLELGTGFQKYGDFTQNAVGNFDLGFSNNISKEKRVPYPILPDFNLGFSTKWQVDIWHKLQDNMRARHLDLLAKKESLNFLKMLIVYELSIRYYELLSMDYAFEVLDKNINFQQNAIEIVRVQKQRGYLSSLAIQQLEAQLLTMRTTQKQIVQNIINLEFGINNLLGRTFNKVERSLASFSNDSLLLDLSKSGFSTRVLLARRDILQSELSLASAEIDINVARKAFFPDLNLSSFLGLNSFSLAKWFNIHSLAANLLGGLTYPLFNKSRLRANLQQKRAQAKQELYKYHKVVISGYNEVQKNLQLLNILKDNYLLQQKRLILLDESKHTATELAMSGYANYLEIITAQRYYLDALLESIKVRQQIFSTYIELYRSLGGGWK